MTHQNKTKRFSQKFSQGKEVPVYPELYHYLASSLYQIENKFPSVFNAEWYSILTGLQAKDPTKFTEFLDFSYDLLL